MSKPFLIINVVDGVVGVICKTYDYENALQIATDMANKQYDTQKRGHTPREEIKDWLQINNAFYGPNGNWSVQIA